MSLPAGTKLGPYEILAPIGAGGMGEVYRARDTRLGRDVAVKVLPEHLSSNPEIRARFEREAKTVSSLNHPNICTLFDVGREGETEYLVMELIEGETLADRLAQRGAMNAADLLRIGMQIADALDRAHRANVIHRDLKPGNVMLTRSGAKLMDFGLARATGLAAGAGAPGSGSVATMTHSPTIAKALTAEGTLLGTFQYMSPEQLEGAEADARSDIWALGCVLYEMATGRRAFEGRSQASLIAAILERDPPPIPEAPPSGTATATGGVPHGLDRLIRNCLNKDPEERIQTAHDVKLQLRGIGESAGYSTPSGAYSPTTPLPGSTIAPGAAVGAAGRRGRTSPLPWIIAGLATVAAIAAFATLYPKATAKAPAYHFRVNSDAPGSVDAFWPRVSPDGRLIAFLAVDSTTTSRAYVRRMDEIRPRLIAGTEGINRFYWSPDSREIAFIQNNRMMRVPVAGGAPVVICQASGGADVSWGSKGKILMDGRRGDSILVVPAAGGELEPATIIDRKGGETGQGWPCFLPDGEHFLYITYKDATNLGTIRLGKLGSMETKALGQTDGRVEYAPGGWMVFMRGTTLLAQQIDVSAGKVKGQPITLVEGVRTGQALGHFSISNNGIMTYAQLATDATNSVVLAGRNGLPLGSPIASGDFRNPRLSPDGKKIVIERRSAFGTSAGEISVLDIARRTETKLSFSGGRATSPRWSPDGRRVAWMTTDGSRPSVIHAISADGLGAQDSVVLARWPSAYLAQWDGSLGGSRWIYYALTPTNATTYAVPAAPPHSPETAVIDTTMISAWSEISPDGRWIAFASGRNPDVQIFVQSLKGEPGRWQITSAPGGYAPHWTRGGREIVWQGFDNRIWSAEVDTRSGFQAGTPRPLFANPTRIGNVSVIGWDCNAAGDTFVLLTAAAAGAGGTMDVVTDFAAMVNRR